MSSFGKLSWFRKDNAPEGSTHRCTDGCTIERECPYSAVRIYYDRREWTYVFDLPDEDPERGETIYQYIKDGPYGRCVYRSDNDVVDHQVCSMLFEDDTTATFQMEAFTHYGGRKSRIMGSMGDLVGDSDELIYADFRTGEVQHWNVADHIEVESGHGGGDWRLVKDFLRAVDARDVSLLTSNLDASMDSHLMCFTAEESRRDLQTIKIDYS